MSNCLFKMHIWLELSNLMWWLGAKKKWNQIQIRLGKFMFSNVVIAGHIIIPLKKYIFWLVPVYHIHIESRASMFCSTYLYHSVGKMSKILEKVWIYSILGPETHYQFLFLLRFDQSNRSGLKSIEMIWSNVHFGEENKCGGGWTGYKYPIIYKYCNEKCNDER